MILFCYSDFKYHTPLVADYLSNCNGSGEDIDVKLHQSRTETGNPLFEKVARLKWYLGDEFEQRVTEVMKDIAELSPDSIRKDKDT